MHFFRLPLAEILLRVGLAFSFIYPPLAALGDPDSWIGYFPAFILSFGIEPLLLLHVFGVIEVVIAFWILFGKRPFIPSVIAAALLLLIVACNALQFPILFRDVTIALMALALAWQYRPHGR